MQSLRAERAYLPRCRALALSLISMEHRTPKVHRHFCVWWFYWRPGELGLDIRVQRCRAQCSLESLSPPLAPWLFQTPFMAFFFLCLSGNVMLGWRVLHLAREEFSAFKGKPWIFLWSWGEILRTSPVYLLRRVAGKNTGHPVSLNFRWTTNSFFFIINNPPKCHGAYLH